MAEDKNDNSGSSREWSFLTLAMSGIALLISGLVGFVEVQSWWEQRAGPRVETLLQKYRVGIINENLEISATIAIAVQNRSSRDLRIIRCENIYFAAHVADSGYGRVTNDCALHSSKKEGDNIVIPAKEFRVFCSNLIIKYEQKNAEQELYALGFNSSEILGILFNKYIYSFSSFSNPDGSRGFSALGNTDFYKRVLSEIRINFSNGDVIEKSISGNDYKNWSSQKYISPCL